MCDAGCCCAVGRPRDCQICWTGTRGCDGWQRIGHLWGLLAVLRSGAVELAAEKQFLMVLAKR